VESHAQISGDPAGALSADVHLERSRLLVLGPEFYFVDAMAYVPVHYRGVQQA
jgi:hypothetical protein